MTKGLRRVSGGLTMVRAIAAPVLLLALAVGSVALPAAAGPKAVIELFTSQGCASCPPADRLAGTLAQDKDLVVLSLPIDYWDYLGWKDTLARPEFTERQKAYSRVLGNTGVYTPQVIVNGREHVIGSDAQGISIAVKRQMNRYDGLPVPISLASTGNKLTVVVGSEGADGAEQLAGGSATLWLVTYEPAREVPIGRGENGGRTVTYTNVVRTIQPIGMWDGGHKTIELPRDEILKKGAGMACAVILQQDLSGRPGAILGAAKM